MDKICIIICVYNQKDILFERCINSILNQTYSNFLLLIVDDGSVDKTSQLCEEYQKADSRIICIHNHNGGAGTARNVGICFAQKCTDCRWIAFVDSDDWVHKEYLSIMLYANKSNNSEVAWCGFIKTSSNIEDADICVSQVQIKKCPANENTWINILHAFAFCTGHLYSREVLRGIRFSSGRFEDERTTYRIVFAARNIAVVSAGLYYYYQNPASFMHTMFYPQQKDDQLNSLIEPCDYFYAHNQRTCFERYIRTYLEYYFDMLQDYAGQKEYVGVISNHRKIIKNLPSRFPELLSADSFKQIYDEEWEKSKRNNIRKLWDAMNIVKDQKDMLYAFGWSVKHFPRVWRCFVKKKL